MFDQVESVNNSDDAETTDEAEVMPSKKIKLKIKSKKKRKGQKNTCKSLFVN